MKKIILFILISVPLFAQELNYIPGDTVAINKLRLGNLSAGYDVNLYRDSSDQLKTDDNFEANSYRIGNIEVISPARELKYVTFGTGTKLKEFQDSKLWVRDDMIEEYLTNGTGTLNLNYAGYNHSTSQFRNLAVGNGKGSIIFTITGSTGMVTLDDVTGDAATLNSATIGRLNMTSWISSTSDIDIRPASGSSVAFNYGNSGAGADVLYYNSTSVIASIQETGAIYSASTIDGTAYKVAGNVGTAGQVLVSNGSTGAVWGTISAANDTANMVTKGSTQVISGEKYFTNTTHFSGDILSTYVIRNPLSALDLRAGNGTTGQDIALGYNTGYGKDLIHYGGTTSAKFISYADGRGYFAGDVTVPTEVYGGGWNGSNEVPTKDAVYDKIESLVIGGSTAFSALSGGTNTGASMIVGSGASLTATGGGYIDATRFSGVTTVSGTEFGYLDGVTSGIQSQLNNKLDSGNNLSDISNASTARSNLGLGTIATSNNGYTVTINFLDYLGDNHSFIFTNGILQSGSY